MARFFVLGPSVWRRAAPMSPRHSPLAQRRRLVALLASTGHDAFIMRDVAGSPGEPTMDKFLRILQERQPTHCLLYWPAHASVDAAQDELVILRTLVAQGMRVPELWIWAQEGLIEERRGNLIIRDDVGRSAYILDLVRAMPCIVTSWNSHGDLETRLGRIAQALPPDGTNDA